MIDREIALRNLASGDVFHGRSPNGARLICLVTEVTESTIFARRITTQDNRQFNRQTGLSLDDVGSKIDCVAPLPSDLYDIFLAMDQKGQTLAEMFRNGTRPDIERYKITPEERRAFHLFDEHIAANPI